MQQNLSDADKLLLCNGLVAYSEAGNIIYTGVN